VSVPHVQIILASVREGRQGERVAKWFHAAAAQRTDLTFEVLDLRDWPLPAYTLAKPVVMAEADYADPIAKRWVETLARADAFVIVTPEYNHSFSAVLKNALDWAYAPWNRKPLGIVSYGGPSGGIRCAQSLKLVAVELMMVPLRNEVNIPFVGKAFDEAGALLDKVQVARAPKMLDELSWYARVLKAGRAGAV